MTTPKLTNYLAIAQAWLKKHPNPTAEDLAQLLRAQEPAELPAAIAPISVQSAPSPAPVESDPVPSPAPELSRRQEDALTLKTLKIIGKERTHTALKAAPHKLRAVAQHARVEPKILRDFLAGRGVRTQLSQAIKRSLRELGYPTEPGLPSRKKARVRRRRSFRTS